jgi:hypothetical protein
LTQGRRANRQRVYMRLGSCGAQALLQLLGQCGRTFLRAATGAVAQSVAATGIEVGLPQVPPPLAVRAG